MKSVIETAQSISLILLGLLTLFILGAEPSEYTADGIERYEASIDYWQPIMLWTWLVMFILFIGLVITNKLIKK